MPRIDPRPSRTESPPSSSVAADWSWTFPYPFLGGFSGTAVSDDGERFAGLYDFEEAFDDAFAQNLESVDL